jgi:cytidylate kinase
MPIVTISRGSYSRAKEVAEKVAAKLGFDCVSQEVLVEASEEFNVPEIELLRAFRDAPSFKDRFTFGKERYVAYVQAALLSHFQNDNVVYHGLAGHYFVGGVSHVLKVRIIGKMENRVKELMHREEVFEQAATAMKGLAPKGVTLPKKHRAMTEEKAWQALKEVDEARREWGLHLYGIDTNDPNLYDLVIHIDNLSTDDAADIISSAAALPCFQATPESQQAMDDLLLAARVKASLVERYPRANVTAEAGSVYIGIEGAGAREEKEILEAAGQVPGVKNIDVRSYPFMTPD